MKGRRQLLPMVLFSALAGGLLACSEPPPDAPPPVIPEWDPPIGPLGAFGEYKAPATAPLDSVAELAAWQPDATGADPWNVAGLALLPRPPADAPAAPWVNEPQSPAIKLIHCHDMMGGYVPTVDLYPQGVDNDSIYNFGYWQYVDTFVYFSHHRVTIPPPGWTVAAHRSGVRVLGTFITGSTDKDEVDALLDEPQPGVFPMAEKLSAMASYHGFDGWFLNLETPLSQGGPVCSTCDRLARFLDSLRKALKAQNPAAEVIWYDSVTASGAVAYQNSLTDQNKLYFDNADGLFTNYWWDIDPGYPSPSKSASLAGDRSYDVYTGTDMFGRGTYAGGGFKAWVALKAIAEAGTSAALFAPGWTYEKASAKSPFQEREDRVWTGTGERDCEPLEGVAAYVRPRAVPSSLPFVTSFNQGQGPAFFVGGKKVWEKPWANIAQVDVLPTWRRCPVAGAGAPFNAGFTADLAYDGPSSWWIGAPGAAAGDFSVQALYKAQIAIDKELTFSYTLLAGGLDLAVVLVLDDQTALVLAAAEAADFVNGADLGGSPQRVVLSPAESRSTEGWETRAYTLDGGGSLKGRTVASIGVIAFAPPGSAPSATPVARLGELRLFDPGEIAASAAARDLAMTDVVWSMATGALEVGLTLQWSGDLAAARSYDVFQVSQVSQVSPSRPARWLGRAFTTRFSVAPGAATPFEGENFVRFAVQPSGRGQAPDGAPATIALLWQPPP